MPEGKYYLYMPTNPEIPHAEIPMAQSYMDVIVEAFLEHDEALAKEVIESFLEHKTDPLINDRHEPRYSRYLERANIQKIDELMKAHATCMIENRTEAESEVPLNKDLANSIIATLKFYDLFQFPLTLNEIKDNLYGYNHKSIHVKEIEGTLNILAENGHVAELKGYYVLSGSERNIETRKTRKFIAEKFWNRTKLYGQYMRMIPFVKMVAVCNNLAYDNPSELSDIDLFIVIKNGRMWTSRLLLTLVLHFFGVRRHGNKVAGRFCLSFFVTEKAMDLEKISLQPEDPYLAYWLKNLKPIFGEETFIKFTEKNKWLHNYELQFNQEALKHLYVDEKSPLKNISEFVLKGWFGNLIESLLKRTLKKKTLKGIRKLGPEASVVVSDNMLKFHNHDKRKDIYRAWKSATK